MGKKKLFKGAKKIINNCNYLKIKRKIPISRIPKFLKFKRYFKILIKRNNTTQINNIIKTKLQYGTIGIRSLQNGYIKLTHIDILKKFLYPITKTKYAKSLLINLFIKVFTNRILTEKPAQARIGRGKGNSIIWYTKVYKNEIFIEVSQHINQYKCLTFIKLIAKKLPFKTQIIQKREIKKGSITTTAIKRIPLQSIYIA